MENPKNGKHTYNFSEIRDLSVEKLNSYGEELILLSEYRAAQGIFSKAKNKARFENDIEEYVIALSGLGNAFHNLGQTADAIMCHKESIQIAIDNEINYLVIVGYHNLSLVMLDLGELEIAKDYVKEYESIRLDNEGLKNNEYCNAGYYLIRGFISERESDLNEAERFLLKAKESALYIEDDRSLSICLHNLAQLYHQMGDFDKSEKYLIQSLESKERRQDLFGLAHDYLAYAVLEGERENYNQMLNCIQKAHEISHEIEAEKLVGVCLNLFATHCFNICEFERALEYLDEAIKYHDITQSKIDLVDSFVLASKIHIRRDNHMAAFECVSNAVSVQISTTEITIHPDLEPLLLGLADVYLDMVAGDENFGDIILQIADLMEKINSNRDSAKLYSNYGVFLYENQNFLRSKKMLKKSFEIFIEIGDVGNAELVMENIIELDSHISEKKS